MASAETCAVRVRPVVLAASLAAAALCPPMASADGPAEARLREALRSTTSQLQALEDERGKWQAKEAELHKEVESLRSQLAQAKLAAGRGGARKSAELERRLADQAAADSALKEAHAKLGESLSQCEKAAREASEAARAKEDERARLAGDVSSLERRLAAAGAKNARMFAVGKEILQWALRDDIGETGQTVLGLERVKLENAAQDYEDDLLDQKVKP